MFWCVIQWFSEGCWLEIFFRDVKLVFFRNRSSSRDNRLLTDHRNQGNSSGRRLLQRRWPAVRLGALGWRRRTSSASPPSLWVCNDAAASDINSRMWPYAAKRSDSGNNSHGFVTGSKTVAVTNGCETASALLSEKRSSRAARRLGLKSAMVSKSSAHSARSCVTSLVTSG